MFVSRPLLRENVVEQREYQTALASSVLARGNSLVVLPTGLGKTTVAALVAAEVLSKNPGKKVLVLAPTKPLAAQHFTVFKEIMALPDNSFVLLTGATKQAEREALWQQARVVSATPQTIQHDVARGRIGLADVGLLVVDETHRAVKKYSYVDIAKNYFENASSPLVLGLTASPSVEKIKAICKNLGIKNVETRSEEDADVKPYVFEKDVERVFLDLPPEFEEVRGLLRGYADRTWEKMRESGFVFSSSRRKRDLIKLQQGLIKAKIFPGIILSTALLKAMYATELLETQGVPQLFNYFERLKSDDARTAKTMLKDESVAKAIFLAGKLYESGADHPKLAKLVEVVRAQLPRKIIIFANYRDSAQKIVRELEKNGIRAVRFVGQATRKNDAGLSQEQQQQIIKDFRAGEYDALVCTSVGEEGLDIPSVDVVVFYEPVPSEIRKVQREGRTGRRRAGKVVFLITRGTSDEASFWASRAKERKMRRVLSAMRTPQKTLDLW